MAYPRRTRATPHSYADEQFAYHVLTELKQQERHYKESLYNSSDDDDNDDEVTISMRSMTIDDDEDEIENELHEEKKEEKWSAAIEDLEMNINDFLAPPRRDLILSATQSVCDFFLLLIPMSFIAQIVRETNKHAAMQISSFRRISNG